MKENVIIRVRDVTNIDKFLNLDFSKFIELNVNTAGIDNSNMFLNSLWREFNLQLSPEELKRCPWAYLPQKIITKHFNITYFGS